MDIAHPDGQAFVKRVMTFMRDTAVSAKKLIRKITNRFRLPYITISPTFSICPSHSYIAGEHFNCSKCDAETEVYSRIVGYMRPVKQWNNGKQQEFKDRKLFRVDFSEKPQQKVGEKVEADVLSEIIV